MNLRSLAATAAAMTAVFATAASGEPVRLSHNHVETVLQPGTVAGVMEGDKVTTRDNSWWRIFSRRDFEVQQAIDITAVRIGVEKAKTALGFQVLTVTLYEMETGAWYTLKEIGRAYHPIVDQSMSLVTIPVEARLAPGHDLLVQVTPPDHGASGPTGDVFFIGCNRYGQTAEPLLSCPSAGDASPVPYRKIMEEAADLAVVMTVFGSTGCDGDCDDSGATDFFDFLCFLNLFSAQSPEADCDGSGALDMFDFLCFQNLLAAGCE